MSFPRRSRRESDVGPARGGLEVRESTAVVWFEAIAERWQPTPVTAGRCTTPEPSWWRTDGRSHFHPHHRGHDSHSSVAVHSHRASGYRHHSLGPATGWWGNQPHH